MEELPNLYFMRARYYSAEAGVFLSTDPVKNIGPGWKPSAYSYASGNPTTLTDPKGEFVVLPFLIAAGFYYVYEQTTIRPANVAAEQAKLFTKVYAGAADGEDVMDMEIERITKDVPFADLATGVVKGAAGSGWGDLGSAALNYVPFGQTVKLASNIGSTVGYASYGIERDLKASFGQGSGVQRGSSSMAPTAAGYAGTLNKVQQEQLKPAPQAAPVAQPPKSGGGGLDSKTASNLSSSLTSISKNLGSFNQKQLNQLSLMLKQLGSTLTKIAAQKKK